MAKYEKITLPAPNITYANKNQPVTYADFNDAISGIENSLNKWANNSLGNLDYFNVRRLYTNYCNIQSEDGETVIDGPQFIMRSAGSTTIRLSQGYNPASSSFEYNLYDAAGNRTFYVDSTGHVVLTGKPLIEMYGNSTTLRLQMGYLASTNDFVFKMFDAAGNQSIYLNASGEAVFAGNVQTDKNAYVGNDLYVGTNSTDFKGVRLRTADPGSTNVYDAIISCFFEFAPILNIGYTASTNATNSAITALQRFNVYADGSVFSGSVEIDSQLTVYGSINSSGSVQCSSGFGCNGAEPQGKYAVGSALSTTLSGSTDLLIPKANSSDVNKTRELLNDIRAALVANGICV